MRLLYILVSSFLGVLSCTNAKALPYNAWKGTPGYWSVARDSSGVWWFVDPKSTPIFLNSITSVQPFQLGRDQNGLHFISKDWKKVSPDIDSHLRLESWATSILDKLSSFGFRGVGSWSDRVFHKMNIPVSRDLNVLSEVSYKYPRIFDDGWRDAVERYIKEQVEPLKNNINLVGYFSDNEMNWSPWALGAAHYFDHLRSSDPNRQEYLQVVRLIWPLLKDFNKDWKTKFTTWNDLATSDLFPSGESVVETRLFTAWRSHYAETYFETIANAIHRYDPNHLILGVRFRAAAADEVLEASRRYVDVQSVNYYSSDAKLIKHLFERLSFEGTSPVMISEYSFHSRENNSVCRNTIHFTAGEVSSQKERAQKYEVMTQAFARVPFIVGADYFQWNDEPPSGRQIDGEDVNFGVVDVHDEPYPDLVSAIRRTSKILDSTHSSSWADSEEGIWRTPN